MNEWVEWVTLSQHKMIIFPLNNRHLKHMEFKSLYLGATDAPLKVHSIRALRSSAEETGAPHGEGKQLLCGYCNYP